MKVQEKGSDRRAELRMHVLEQVEELAEYGQYIDPIDKAVCCYVPVEDGNIIKLVGRFHGTTFSMHWDLHVDGILRKANNLVSRVVKYQRNVKLDIDEALYKVDNGIGDTKILDTQMKVTHVSGLSFTQNKSDPETIGTVEVRLWVLRTFGAEHSLDLNTVTYVDDGNNDALQDDAQKEVTYRDLLPRYMIEYEKNCQELDKKTTNAWARKLRMKRPGLAPWAIFRFHYRSQESIEAGGMIMSHNPRTKGKGTSASHILDLQSVPPLPAGTKPAVLNDGGSTRADSPTSIPGTPLSLGSPLMQRRFSPPPSPLVQDTPSDNTIVGEPIHREKDSAFKENRAKKTDEDSLVEKIDTTMSQDKLTEKVDKTPIKEDAGELEETQIARTSTEITENSGEKQQEPLATSELVPTPPTAFTQAPNASEPVPLKPSAPDLKRPATSIPPLAPDRKRSKPPTVAETRRQLNAMKARREALAKKRLELDSELEPYRARIHEEQERLARELEEETRLWREDSQLLRDDASMLAELKKAEITRE